MTVFVKNPGAIVDYSIDWSGCGYLDMSTSPVEALTASSWAIFPDAGSPPEIEIVSSLFAASSSSVTIAGGVAGKRYQLRNTIVTNANRTDERTIEVRVAE